MMSSSASASRPLGGNNLMLAAIMALFSYVPFEWMAKSSLLLCIWMFVVDPLPPYTRFMSMLSTMVVLGLTKWRNSVLLLQQDDDVDTMITVVPKEAVEDQDGDGEKDDKVEPSIGNDDNDSEPPATKLITTTTRQRRKKRSSTTAPAGTSSSVGLAAATTTLLFLTVHMTLPKHSHAFSYHHYHHYYHPRLDRVWKHHHGVISRSCRGNTRSGRPLYSFRTTDDSNINITSTTTTISSTTTDSSIPTIPTPSLGLYHKFAAHAKHTLSQKTEWLTSLDISPDLVGKVAPAKGMPDHDVRISTHAFVPSSSDNDDNDDDTTEGMIRYARITLLETVPNSNATADADTTTTTTSTNAGIQVLNFVVLPNPSTDLPVLGIDLVSLPGNKHLLLMDAQPMTTTTTTTTTTSLWDHTHFQEWHARHVATNDNFPWGGDFPEAVQQYVSPYCLWTRLQDIPAEEDPITVIQEEVWQAFVEQLDLYLDLLASYPKEKRSNVQQPNVQEAYLDYRRNNDPAKPMLNALYGKEWTEQLLNKVLFPQQE